jgi:hypothetical protein
VQTIQITRAIRNRKSFSEPRYDGKNPPTVTYGAPSGVTIRELVIAEYVIPGICKNDNAGVKYQARKGATKRKTLTRAYFDFPTNRVETHVAVMIVRVCKENTNDCSKKMKACI